MKLIIFTPNANTGGTERVSSIYAHVLSNKSNHIKVCSIFKPLDAYDSEKYPSLHVSLNLCRVPRFLRPFYLYISFIYYAFLGHKLLIQGEYPAAVSFFLPFKVFIRVTNLPDRLQKSQPLLFALFVQSLKKNICIFPSQFFKESFSIPVYRYHILPNPFQSPSDIVVVDRPSFKLGFNFIAVGQLNFQKNHSFMIHSFSIFVSKHSPFSKLYIYGSGELYNDLSRMIESLGMSKNIFLSGWSSLPWCDNNFDFHLLTSRWEGYPNVIVEAAHFEIPTLSTPIRPGIHLIISDNNIGLTSSDLSIDSFVELLAYASHTPQKSKDSSRIFQEFVSAHSPELLISTLSSYV